LKIEPEHGKMILVWWPLYSRGQRAKVMLAWPWRLPRGCNTPQLAARSSYDAP